MENVFAKVVPRYQPEWYVFNILLYLKLAFFLVQFSSKQANFIDIAQKLQSALKEKKRGEIKSIKSRESQRKQIAFKMLLKMCTDLDSLSLSRVVKQQHLIINQQQPWGDDANTSCDITDFGVTCLNVLCHKKQCTTIFLPCFQC